MKRSADTATQRWKLLRKSLLKEAHHKDECDQVSVRRFTTFDLVKTTYSSSDDDSSWFSYCFPAHNIHLHINHCHSSRDDMLSFNNTGNVCVWPSEEVLTHYCLKHQDRFRGLTVCELGGGMTCLAGSALAKVGTCSRLILTDGNEKSVENVKRIVNWNNLSDVTEVRTLRWDQECDEVAGEVDMIISADCLFFDEYRQGLVRTMNTLLSSNGEAWILAPARSGTLSSFVHIAGEYFIVRVQYDYDEMVTSVHRKMLLRGKQVYDPNLHYPILIKLFRKPRR